MSQYEIGLHFLIPVLRNKIKQQEHSAERKYESIKSLRAAQEKSYAKQKCCRKEICATLVDHCKQLWLNCDYNGAESSIFVFFPFHHSNLYCSVGNKNVSFITHLT